MSSTRPRLLDRTTGEAKAPEQASGDGKGGEHSKNGALTT
jgi:hypothetical protein